MIGCHVAAEGAGEAEDGGGGGWMFDTKIDAGGRDTDLVLVSPRRGLSRAPGGKTGAPSATSVFSCHHVDRYNRTLKG